MKTFISLTLAAAALLALGLDLHSQDAASAKTPLQILQDLKAKNKELIEKQKLTLQKLDELDKEAAQIKALAART